MAPCIGHRSAAGRTILVDRTPLNLLSDAFTRITDHRPMPTHFKDASLLSTICIRLQHQLPVSLRHPCINHSIHLPHSHDFHHTSHFHCFIPVLHSKFIFFTNPFHHSPLAPTGLPLRTVRTGPDLSCSTGFMFQFFYFFLILGSCS